MTNDTPIFSVEIANKYDRQIISSSLGPFFMKIVNECL